MMAFTSGVIRSLVPGQKSASRLPNYGPLSKGWVMPTWPQDRVNMGRGHRGCMKKQRQRERKEEGRGCSNLSIGRK